ncbi:MAG: hypothetical protein AAF702_44535 [Chloroflexota bacterium]
MSQRKACRCLTLHCYEFQGSRNFEWISGKGRAGINIEVDPSQSGWYVVTPGGHSEWGYLDTLDIEYIIHKLQINEQGEIGYQGKINAPA